MIRCIARAPRTFGGLGLGVFAMGLLVGAMSLSATGCGEEATEVQPEKVDFAKKGEDSMKAYMQQKPAGKTAKKK
jgi:hypothetical protein